MAFIQHCNLFIFIWCFNFIFSYPNEPGDILSYCPQLYLRAFKGYIPSGNLSAGTYEEIKGISQLKLCFLKCCQKEKCNVAFMSNSKCYHIICKSSEACLPVLSSNEVAESVGMVLVKPVDEESWDDVMQAQGQDFSNSHLDREIYNILDDRGRFKDIYSKLLSGRPYGETYDCILSEGCSGANEICIERNTNNDGGICICKDGFERNSKGDCVPSDLGENPPIMTERILGVTSNDNKTVPVTRKQLKVTAASKIVKLPENEVTLLATVTPLEREDGEKYRYDWTPLNQPDGSTAVVKHQNGGQLQLSNLVEGLYSFKVTASTTTAYGEAFVNVTVLPPSRINQPPKVVITPANQTIKQPNAAAVIDASSSIDDDGIVSWHWELQQGPLGYQPELKDSATLQLNDLKKPGTYTFKLTITDTDKATSTGTANITVLKYTDYPPEANAGEDKIIYLPRNNITLNGNMSSDDHNITTWEWTKSPDDAQKAVDMQDTRTPYLQLSNLQEGVYTFTLKVTDSSNQSSTAQVHVFVKPPTNKPPVAEAGPNVTLSLPQTWAILDGSNSTDDNKIVSFRWEQLEGPSTVTFENVNASKTNVTGLTKGVYTFKLSVTDDNNNVASDNTYIIVNQNKNQKPHANASNDFEVELPVNIVIVNGSASKDDWAIVKWRWTRDDRSLALGKIAEGSDQSPILMLSDLAVGKYVFNLTVYDEQGLSDTDSVTFTIKQDPNLYYLVEITIDTDARYLTEAQYNNLKAKLALLVTDASKLQVRNVEPDRGEGKAKITFYVEKDGKPVAANTVVQQLREKLRVDASLLGFSVAKLQTMICQNNCSGHGVCDEQSRICHCEAFWMHDLFKLYFHEDGDSNCSWSVLYAVLGFVCVFIIMMVLLWGLVFLCCSWFTKKPMTYKQNNYKLIAESDDAPPFSRKSNISDTDSDSDIVYETRPKPSRFADRNGHKSSRNGFSKMGRKVKT